MADGQRTVRIKFDGTTKGLAAAVSAARQELRAAAKAAADEQRRITAAQREAAAQEKSAMQAAQKAAADHQKALADAARKAEAISKQFADNRSKRFATWRRQLASMAKSVTTFTARAMSNVAALNSGIGAVAGLAAWAGAASGALGLIPGALAAGAAGMLAWKLGADGVKAAFEAATPTLDRLKAAVSGTFRTELAPAVRDINTLLPQTTSHFQRVASAISGTITGFTAMVRQRDNTAALNSTLDSSAGIIRNIGRALAPVGQAFLDLARAGASALERLTSGVGGVAQRFADFVRTASTTGQLDAWIQGGIDAFRDLWALLSDVGSIVTDVFSALREGGAGVAPILSPLIDTVKRFVQSPQGQETFRTLGEALAKVGDALSRILGPALEAVGPLIVPFADLLGDIAGILADALGPALQMLGQILKPVFDALAPVIRQLVQGLAPIIPVLVQALAPLAAGLILLAPVIMLLNVPLIGAITLLAAFARLMAGDVVGAGQVMSQGMQQSSATMRTITETNWGGMAEQVMNAMGGMQTNVFGGTDQMTNSFGNGLTQMQGSTSSAFGNIGGMVRGGLGGMVSAIGNGIGEAVRWFASLPGRALDALGDLGSKLFQSGVSLISGFINGITSRIGAAVNAVSGVLSRVRDMFPFSPAKEGPFSGRGWVLYSGMSIADGLADGVLARAGAAVAAVRAMSGRVASAVPDGLLTPVPSAVASGPLVGGVPAARGASSSAGTVSGGRANVIELTVDLGKGLTERVRIEIDEAGRATARAAGAGTGGMR